MSSLLLRGSSGSHAIIHRECTTGVLTKRLKVKNGWALWVIFMFLLLSTPQPCQLLDGRNGGSQGNESHTKHCKISINKEVVAFRNRSESLTSHNFPLLVKEWETYSIFSRAWIWGNMTLRSSFYQVWCSLPEEGEDRVVPRYCNILLRPVF